MKKSSGEGCGGVSRGRSRLRSLALPWFAGFWALALVACRERSEVVITQTRPVTTADVAPKLDATSAERFLNEKPSPVKGTTPDGWQLAPRTQLRLLNYTFGADGSGQVWVSVATGTVLDNLNRWRGQFRLGPISADEMDGIRRVPMCGGQAVWVEAEGDYSGPMDSQPVSGQGLAGAILDDGQGRIVTVKMLGPKAEVDAQKPVLETFIASLELAK